MTESVLLTTVHKAVMTLTLNRPAARNALSPVLITALDAALTRLEDDDGIHVAVITGSGSAFCAGLDLTVFAPAEADTKPASALINRFGRLAKPVIGAINGPAVTGGLEIALGCDFLIGSPAAVFIDTHRTVGAFPGGGLSARLPAAVGLRTAKAMSLAGMRLDAAAALRCGLLCDVVDGGRLLARADELAHAAAETNQTYVCAVRALYNDNADRSLADALAAERAHNTQWRNTQPRQWRQ
jgi:enoyl-CoA hydratase